MCSIYLALCTQTFPNPFRGTHCTTVSVILPYQNTAKVYTYTVFRKGIETRSVPPLENLIFFQWFCTPLVLRRGVPAESWLASCSQRSWFTGIYCFTFVILLLCQRGGKANLRVLGQNLRVLDKILCVGQNPWLWTKCLGPYGQILGFWTQLKSCNLY